MEWEIHAQRFGIDRVFLFLELVCVIAPIPDIDFGGRILCFLCFHFSQLGDFRGKLRLDSSRQVVDVFLSVCSGLGHTGLGLIIRPRFVTESQGDLVAEREHLIEHGDVRVFRQRIMNDVKLLACGFASGVFLNRHELPGHICHYRVSVIPGLDSRGRKKTIGNSIEFGFRENNRRFDLDELKRFGKTKRPT